MRSYRHYYHNKVYRAIHSDFWKLEFFIWGQTFGWSLVGLFLPILMLRNGYSLEAVIIYNILFYGIDIPLNFLARRLILAWGARRVTMLGCIFTAAYLVVFHSIALGGWPILAVLAVFLAFSDAFYWVGHFYLFVQSSGRPEAAGRSTGIVNGVRILGGMFGPALGAAVLLLGGQSTLLVVAVCVLLVGLIPLFTLRHTHDKPESTMSFREFMKAPREKRDYLSFMLFGVHATAENPIWPIFIFMVLGTLNSIALLAVVVSVSTVLLSYATGVATRKGTTTLMYVGSICAAAIWIVRLLIPNPVVYYASVLLVGFFSILVSVPIESSIVERGRIKDALWAATIRNTSSMVSPFILFLALLPIVAVFKISFVSAALSLFALMIIMRWFAAVVAKDSGAVAGR